jgi:hypothetical protein
MIAAILGFLLGAITLSTTGCSEISQIRQTQKVLSHLISVKGTEADLYLLIPKTEWTVYVKDNEHGRGFEQYLQRERTSDLDKVRTAWRKYPKMLSRGTESSTTMVFIDTNGTVAEYYMVSQ